MIDPISRVRAWLRAAGKAGAPIPEAMVLATVDHRGRPSARFMLLKEATGRGFVFYTNANSRKGDEIHHNDRVAMAFYWDVTGKQVRIEGKARLLPAAEADQYWKQRPLGSRYAAAASEQSRPVASRRELLKRYASLEAAFPDGDIPRPPHWLGYLVVPDAIEFWTRAEPRFHERELFTRVRGKSAPAAKAAGKRGTGAAAATKWKSEILQP